LPLPFQSTDALDALTELGIGAAGGFAIVAVEARPVVLAAPIEFKAETDRK
jgi:hypothetical protein